MSTTSKQQYGKSPAKSVSKTASDHKGTLGQVSDSKAKTVGHSGGAGSNVPEVKLPNGKTVTPQRLIPGIIAASTGRPKKKAEGGHVNTILENVSDDKPHSAKGGKQKGDEVDKMMPSRMNNLGAASKAEIKHEEEERRIIQLSETETTTILSIPSLVMEKETKEANIVMERNKKYEELVNKYKTSADSIVSHQTQTLNNPQKPSEDQTDRIEPRAVQCQVTAYDIADAMKSIDNMKKAAAEAELISGVVGTATDANTGGNNITMHSHKKVFGQDVPKYVDDTLNVSKVTPGCLFDLNQIVRADTQKKVTRKANTQGTLTHVGSTMDASSSQQHKHQHALTGSGPSGQLSAADSGSSHDVVGQTPFTKPSHRTSSVGVPDEEAQIDSAEVLREKRAEDIMASPMLLKRLQMIERAVQQNAYHRPQLDYRDLPDVPPLSLVNSERTRKVENEDSLFGMLGGLGGGSSTTKKSDQDDEAAKNAAAAKIVVEEEEDPAKIKNLFSFFYDELVQGRSVTSMAWNAVNCDILAVGYGKVDFFVDNSKLGEPVDEQLRGGIVLFWSLRNPEYPEKILRTPHPVTAVDFSVLSPMTLAVGMLTGDILIFDVKRDDWSTPVESSEGVSGGHSDPVWQLKWVVRGQERIETLISISTDGTVLEWSRKKGLAVKLLMTLRRGGMGEGWISRQAAGLGFDFAPDDLSVYMVGTEEGSLHKCSVSYDEQYLETYQGHDGPVYRVRFSQRCPNLFLTCSADWTVGLYHTHEKQPLTQMRSKGEDFAVNDICWCPGNSTVFAAVTVDAKLQVWDLSVSNLDPIFSYDTSVDDVTLPKPAIIPEEAERIGTAASAPSTAANVNAPPPAPAHRYGRMQKEEDKEPLMMKLLKNLSHKEPTSKRVLTTVLFGARSPTVVVGDDKGAVTVYRIVDPVTITHEGPKQQADKLNAAVALLASDEGRQPGQEQT